MQFQDIRNKLIDSIWFHMFVFGLMVIPLKYALDLTGLKEEIQTAIVIAIVIGIIYRRVINSIHWIITSAERIAQGDLESRIPVKGPQEMRRLINSFNHMTDTLQGNQQATEKHLQELRMLYEISTAVSQTLDLEQLLDYLANHLAHLVDATSAFIVFWDDLHQEPIPQAAYGPYADIYRSIRRLPGEASLAEAAIRERRPIEVYDVQNSNYVNPRVANLFPDKSLLGVPMIVNNQPIGAILIGENRRNRSFTDHEIQLILSVTSQVAAAVTNAQHFGMITTERNRLNAILNAITDAILVTDSSWRLQFLSRSVFQLTQIEPNSLMGKYLWEYLDIPEDSFPETKQKVDSSLQENGFWREEMAGKKADGKPYDADVVITHLPDPKGGLFGYVISIHDITSIKEIDRMKDQFVSNVSHELRTPLSVVSLYTENLIEFYENISNDQRRELLSDLKSEINTLHKLVEDLLSLSRLDSGRWQTKPVVFSLTDFLSEMEASIRILANEKDITFRITPPIQSIQSVTADRDQIAQALRNILSNAVKFTPSGGRVWIDTLQVGKFVMLQITDTGIGIPPEDLGNLFQRFYRSKLSIQNEIPGAGLGLAITHEIVHRNGGRIEVQSVVGKGTTFQIYLPIAESTEKIYQINST